MRYIVMHKTDATIEAGGPPDRTIVENMGKLIGRSIKDGSFLDGTGLHRSALRARVAVRGGEHALTRGPYTGGNELPASFARVVASSLDHAIELATSLAAATGERDVEVEIGPVVEGWDLTGKPRPADAPHRFLLLRMATATTEAGAPQPPAERALLEAWRRDGTLEAEGALAPSARGVRSRVVDGKRGWIDGPFTESKELVSGFSIVELPTLEAVEAWAEAYAAILGDNEVDVRPVV